MNEDQIGGSMKNGFGKAESKLGGVFGDSRTQARGASNQIEGSIQEIYGRAVDHANKVVGDVDRMVSEKTYASLGIVAGVALVVGLLLGAGRTKVVYVRK